MHAAVAAHDHGHNHDRQMLLVQAVVLEDIFEISDKDPNGKKFDKGV
jgi:hypothetical protein